MLSTPNMEIAVDVERLGQNFLIFRALNLDRSERGKVRGEELGIEKGIATCVEAGDEVNQRDFGRIGRRVEHAFSKERAAKRQSV